jgi:hypothetical protein
MKDMIKTKDAKKGGYLVGKPHSEGGIKGINVDTNQPIEVEGGEVVITKPAVESQETYEFEGKEMKPREILSKINADHGGVAFAKGGMVGKNEYAQGGEVYTDFIKSLNDYYKDKPFLECYGGVIDGKVKYVDKIFISNITNDILVKYQGADIEKAISLTDCIFKGTYLYVKPPTKEYEKFFDKDYQEIVENRIGYDGCAPFQVSDFSVVVSGKIAQLNLARRLFIKGKYEGLQDFWLDEKYFNSNVVSILPTFMAKYGSFGFYYSRILGNNDLKFISYPKKLNLGFIVAKKLTSNLLINEYTDLNIFQRYYEKTGKRFESRTVKNNLTTQYGADNFTFLSVGAKVKIKLLDDQPLWEIDKTKIVRDDHSYYTVKEYITPQNSPVYVKSISPSTSEIVVTIDGFNLTYQDFDRTITLGCYYFTAENGKTYSTAFYGYYDMYAHFSRLEVVEVIETVYEKYLKGDTDDTSEDNKKTEPEPTPSPESAKEPTPAELLEAEIIVKKKKDESNAIKYELLLEGIEMEEAKLIVMRAISKDNPIRLKEIDRKLETIARKKGEYALKKDTALDLLDKFENSVQAEKVTEEIREYNISINGQQSELTPSQYTRVRTEMFMDWFGNWIDAYETNDYTGVSKVINPRTVEPIVLYHGTDKDFTAWTFDQFPAAYFADNLSYSEWFASQKSAGEEGQLYEVFLSIKNPIDFRMFGLNEVSMRDILAHLQNECGLNSADYLPVLAKLDKTALERALDLKLKIWQFVRKTSGFIKYLKDETFFDGILMFEDNPDDKVGGVPNVTGSYVAFFTSQIKWATANFFNPAIEDNRFKFGGTV